MKLDKNKFPRQDCSSNEDDSSSSEDDENAELLTEELEEGFFKVLSRLKKKDSKLYEESVNFFTTNTPENYSQPNSKEGKTKKKSQKEFREWLKGRKNKVENDEVKEELKDLHEFWTNPNLNKDEKFLRDYILNQKFLEADENFNVEEEINKLSDEEKEVEKELVYEHKYNCRFENQDEELVEETRQKTKRKKNKQKEDMIENSGGLETNEIENETGTEPPKKKKKKKRNSENKTIFEETKENNKIEQCMKRDDKKNILATKQINTKNKEDINQVVKSVKMENGEDKKSLKKKKRHNRVHIEQGKTTLNSSSENVSQSEDKHFKKKQKKNRERKNSVSETSASVEKLKPTVSKDEHKPMHNLPRYANLPRNLKMKNEKKKMRHRNRKRVQWIKTSDRVSVQQDGKNINKVPLSTVAINEQKMKIKQINYNKQNKLVVGPKKEKNNFKNKNNKHFQNLIVKEKKDKALKFSKIHSKKHKSANVLKR